MPKPGELINEGFDLLSYLVKKQEPEVTGEMPSVQELEAKFHEIYSENPVESAPEIENAGKVSEKEEQGLSQGSQSVSQGTACIPCVNDHLSTCAGLVSDESVRMARRHGIDDDEVIRRILRCSDQLNAMEREDLSTEKISSLPAWEKEIAIYAQNETADIRHKLNNISNVDDLENVAIQIIESRDKIGKEWLKGRIANMNPEEKAKVREKAQEMLNKELNNAI